MPWKRIAKISAGFLSVVVVPIGAAAAGVRSIGNAKNVGCGGRTAQLLSRE